MAIEKEGVVGIQEEVEVVEVLVVSTGVSEEGNKNNSLILFSFTVLHVLVIVTF